MTIQAWNMVFLNSTTFQAQWSPWTILETGFYHWKLTGKKHENDNTEYDKLMWQGGGQEPYTELFDVIKQITVTTRYTVALLV